jgi:hypothetical protein
METLQVITNEFDFRKMKKFCNVPECFAKPEKGFIIEEIELKKQKKRELAKIYVCKEHFDKVKNVVRKLNESSVKKGKIIRISQG